MKSAVFYQNGQESPAKVVGNTVFVKNEKPMNRYMNTWLFKGYTKEFDTLTINGKLLIFEF